MERLRGALVKITLTLLSSMKRFCLIASHQVKLTLFEISREWNPVSLVIARNNASLRLFDLCKGKSFLTATW